MEGTFWCPITSSTSARTPYAPLEERLHHGRGHRVNHAPETLTELEVWLNGPWVELLNDVRPSRSSPSRERHEIVEASAVKIILSRKGFDSQYGRIPSPILPDGTLLSFPDSLQPIRDGDSLIWDTTAGLARMIVGLGGDATMAAGCCHHDPDLRPGTAPGWVRLRADGSGADSPRTKGLTG